MAGDPLLLRHRQCDAGLFGWVAGLARPLLSLGADAPPEPQIWVELAPARALRDIAEHAEAVQAAAHR